MKASFSLCLVSTVRCVTIGLLFCAGLAQAAFAGSASSATPYLGFTVRDDAGNVVESQNVSGLFDFNPDTGALNTISTGQLSGNWSWSNIDVANGQILAQKALTWHSSNTTTDGIWQSVVQLKATGNVDPFMNYSFAAKNNTSLNQSFTFSYGESIVPPASGNHTIYSDIGGSLTRGASGNIPTITPTLGDLDGDGISEIQTLKLSTNGGITLFDAGVDVGLAQSNSTTPNTVPFGTYSDSKTINLSSAVNYWQFDVGFTLTPNKDAVALSGSAELTSLTAIPEPSTYAALMGVTTVFGAALIRRRAVTV